MYWYILERENGMCMQNDIIALVHTTATADEVEDACREFNGADEELIEFLKAKLDIDQVIDYIDQAILI